MRQIGSAATTRRWHRRAAPLALAAVLLPVTGCSSDAVEQWQRAGLPVGATDQSDRITSLWVGSWIAALLVGLLVWGLIFWASMVFRRRASDRGLPPQVRYNVPIEVIYTAVPLIVVLVFFYFTTRDQIELTSLSPEDDVNVVEVVGKRWSWDFNYLEEDVYETGTPAVVPTLYLPVDEPVRFDLESRDVGHSFWVPAFLRKLDLYPGRVNQFEVTPTRTGDYAGKCAELCGEDHSRMLFNVRIVERDEYDAYIDGLRAAGQEGRLDPGIGPSVVRANPGSETEQGADQ